MLWLCQYKHLELKGWNLPWQYVNINVFSHQNALEVCTTAVLFKGSTWMFSLWGNESDCVFVIRNVGKYTEWETILVRRKPEPDLLIFGYSAAVQRSDQMCDICVCLKEIILQQSSAEIIDVVLGVCNDFN